VVRSHEDGPGSVAIPDGATSELQVVDLSAVRPAELEGLWQREGQLWRERLFWDVSDRFAALGRVVERGDLLGKAVRVGARIVGYTYYVIGGHLGLIADLVASPESSTAATAMLIQETVDEIRRTGVSRIESSFVSIDGPSLPPLLEREGFRTYWREFLRCELLGKQQPVSPSRLVQLAPLRGSDLREAAAIMQAAYNGGVDAEMSQQYLTYEGCELILQNLLHQGGGGVPVLEASTIARHRGRGIGFIILTEIAARQGHLPQVAVLPEYQRQGLGRLLVSHGLSRLAELGFDTLSLIVSRLNRPALRMYQLMGFQSVLSFPVFTWER
jgi:ribosomal protein S18 acetylase RimI-like enzyme